MNAAMINTSIGKPIRVELIESYFHSLINKFFKILPLYEDNEKTLCEYMRNLQSELIGFQSLLLGSGNDAHLVSLLATLEYLIDMHSCYGFELEKSVIKREVFGAIRVCQKMEQTCRSVIASCNTANNYEPEV